MLTLILLEICVLVVVIISRLIAFMVIRWKVLPINTLSNGHRVHHFVWGNFLILLTSFLVIGLGINVNIFIIILYGIGLGLVLDEFPHWIGNVKELTRNIEIIPGALPVVLTAEVILFFLAVLKFAKVF